MALEIQWGLQPPPTATVAWGARAIYKLRDVRGRTYADIDLLPDRQTMKGGTEAQRKTLATFIKKKGLGQLRKVCAQRYITPECNTLITFAFDGFIIEASPRESYGYLYICVSRACVEEVAHGTG